MFRVFGEVCAAWLCVQMELMFVTHKIRFSGLRVWLDPMRVGSEGGVSGGRIS